MAESITYFVSTQQTSTPNNCISKSMFMKDILNQQSSYITFNDKLHITMQNYFIRNPNFNDKEEWQKYDSKTKEHLVVKWPYAVGSNLLGKRFTFFTFENARL